MVHEGDELVLGEIAEHAHEWFRQVVFFVLVQTHLVVNFVMVDTFTDVHFV